MAPAYKLSYFNMAGFAEPIKLLFAYGDIEFEDFRFSRDEWESSIKQTAPFAVAPLLEYKGKTSDQSTAIARYVAKQVKLMGKNDWEDLEIDATVDTVRDILPHIRKYRLEADEKIQESLKQKLIEEIFPSFLGKFDAQIKNNNGYFVGGKLTWADIYSIPLLGFLSTIDDKWDKNYSNIQQLREKVLSIPSIKTYIANRPPYPTQL